MSNWKNDLLKMAGLDGIESKVKNAFVVMYVLITVVIILQLYNGSKKKRR